MTTIRHVIITCLNAAMDDIATLDVKGWPGYITWMLEAMDDLCDEPTTIELLDSVKKDIDVRLVEGRW